MIELLDKKHLRDNFDCGNTLLNNYIKYQANQDIKRKLSVCYVISDNTDSNIKGYYTLSNNSIYLDSLPENISKKFPKSYNNIPTTLLGRIGVDKKYQGQGYGKILLIDALKRSYDISHKIGSYAVVVDPIDESASDFYKSYEFIELPTSKKMFIPIKTLKMLFE